MSKFRCSKCKAESGDTWVQCKGVCPVSGSPHYNKEYALYEDAFQLWYHRMLNLSLNWGQNVNNPFRTCTQRDVIRDKQTKAELKRSWMDKVLKFEEPELHRLVFPDSTPDEDADEIPY